MSNFTIIPPTKSTLITIEEGLKGQVDIMAQAPDGTSCRLASFCNGKLHLFCQDLQLAKSFGLELDDASYPHIRYVD